MFLSLAYLVSDITYIGLISSKNELSGIEHAALLIDSEKLVLSSI